MNDLERFFITTACFVEAGLAEVGRELVAWRAELGRRPKDRRLRGTLVELLPALSPLRTGASPRELLVTSGSWTAYFDSFAWPTDESACAVLAERLGVRALKVSSDPTGFDYLGMGRQPGMQFHLFNPAEVGGLGYQRTVDAILDGDRWVFETSGEPLDFEEPERYAERRIRDRFTPDMLGRYCAALGIDLFEPGAYGPDGILITSKVAVPWGAGKVRIP